MRGKGTKLVVISFKSVFRSPENLMLQILRGEYKKFWLLRQRSVDKCAGAASHLAVRSVKKRVTMSFIDWKLPSSSFFFPPCRFEAAAGVDFDFTDINDRRVLSNGKTESECSVNLLRASTFTQGVDVHLFSFGGGGGSGSGSGRGGVEKRGEVRSKLSKHSQTHFPVDKEGSMYRVLEALDQLLRSLDTIFVKYSQTYYERVFVIVSPKNQKDKM